MNLHKKPLCAFFAVLDSLFCSHSTRQTLKEQVSTELNLNSGSNPEQPFTVCTAKFERLRRSSAALHQGKKSWQINDKQQEQNNSGHIFRLTNTNRKSNTFLDAAHCVLRSQVTSATSLVQLMLECLQALNGSLKLERETNGISKY